MRVAGVSWLRRMLAVLPAEFGSPVKMLKSLSWLACAARGYLPRTNAPQEPRCSRDVSHCTPPQLRAWGSVHCWRGLVRVCQHASMPARQSRHGTAALAWCTAARVLAARGRQSHAGCGS